MQRLITLIFFLWSSSSLAAPTLEKTTLLFWYPGEAGSPEAAQGLMDSLASYLDAKIPNTKWELRYENTVNGGEKRIKKSHFAVIHWEMEKKFGKKLNMTPLLRTAALPHKTTSEHYYLATGPCSKTPKPVLSIFSKEPLTQESVKAEFPDLSPNQYRFYTLNEGLTARLKAIAEGSCEGLVVSSRTWSALQRIKSRWATALQYKKSAAPHPTAHLVHMGKSTPELAQKLSTTLKNMNQTPEGQALLQTLQLANFQ